MTDPGLVAQVIRETLTWMPLNVELILRRFDRDGI